MVIVEIIRSDKDFLALKDEWHELLPNCSADSIFLTWEWQYLWWKHLGADHKLRLITVRMDGLLVAIAPLVLRPRRFGRLIPFRVLEFIGSGFVGSDYLNILVRRNFEDIVLESLGDKLSDVNLAMELSAVERTTFPVTYLARQLAYSNWRLDRAAMEYCPYIPLEGLTWEKYVSNLGSSHRQNLRRKIRKLDKNFQVRFERVRDEQAREKALDYLVKLHLKRWRQRGGSDAFHDPALIAFHRDFTKLALRKGWLRLYVLWLDEKPAAALYGFQYNNGFKFYQAGFDPDFHAFSVGLVAMGLTIKDAIESGLDEFDFLRGNESYKYLWARYDRELVRINLYPPHPLGAACQFLMRMRKKMIRVTRQLLPERSGI